MSEMNPSTAPALLRVDNLRVSFKGENKQYVETVKGISFEIPANTTVALVGESGSGKSVTSLAVMGLLAPENSKVAEDSQILFEGRDLLKLKSSEMRQICGKEIAMIFQEPMSSLNPVFTVGMQISEILRLHLGMNKNRPVKERWNFCRKSVFLHRKARLMLIRVSYLVDSSNGS